MTSFFGIDPVAKDSKAKRPAKPKTPKAAKPPRLKVRTDDAIALATKALSERYPHDKGGKPALLIAHLPPNDPVRSGILEVEVTFSVNGAFVSSKPKGRTARFYVAAQRFMGPGPGEGRTNVHKVEDDDLDVAIAKMVKHLATSVEHQAELGKAVAK